MAAPKHRIRVRDAAPADARIMAEIDFAAFGTDVIGQLIHPPPVKPEAVAKMAASFFPTESRKDPPNTETLLIVAELLPEDGREDGRGEVVAWAKWVLQREPLPEKVWNAEPVVTAEMLGEGTNLEVYNWFITELHRNLRQLVRGEAHLCKPLFSVLCGLLAEIMQISKLSPASQTAREWVLDPLWSAGVPTWRTSWVW